MIKVITGAPRSGKTYLAVRLLLLTYFRWDEELFTWVPKDPENIPFILTNVDGLKVRHQPIDIFLKNKGLTLPQFLTLEYIVPFLDEIKVPLVLILDEAHGPFPYAFRDKYPDQPEKSTLYFFGYHGHYPIDIYLLTQNWTDLCQSIAQRAEYQIDAERRTMSAFSEFTYYYMHPKTQERINKQVVRSDKKIHMMYVSSSGEHKTNEIKPIRKIIFLIALFSVFVVILFYIMFNKLTSKHSDRVAATPRPPVGAGASGGVRTPIRTAVNMPVSMSESGSFTSTDEQLKGLAKVLAQRQEYIQVMTSGAWVGKELLAIDLFGDVVPVAQIPYSYDADSKNRRITLNIPKYHLAKLRPGLWVSNGEVLSDADNGNMKDIQAATEQAKKAQAESFPLK